MHASRNVKKPITSSCDSVKDRMCCMDLKEKKVDSRRGLLGWTTIVVLCDMQQGDARRVKAQKI